MKLLKFVVTIMTLIFVAHVLAIGVASLNLNVEVRAAKPLNWISETFVSGPLGPNATVILLVAWLGLAMLLLILRYFAGEIGNYEPRERSASKAADAATDVQANDQRRRRLSAQGQISAPKPAPELSIEEIVESMNFDRINTPQPAWQLLPLTNDADPSSATSWIGGAAFAPPQLQWPTFSDGRPLLFLAQINLAQLKPCPQTAQRPAGMPEDGTMYFWIGFDGNEQWEYDVQWYSAADMERAVHHATPTNAITPREIGLFSHASAMKHTPVHLRCVMDGENTTLVSKVMGVEIWDPAYDYHFPTGWQSLLFIQHDDAIGTASEHWQGMAIACPSAELERGEFHGGELFGITNG